MSSPPRMSSSTRGVGLVITMACAFVLAVGGCTGQSKAVYSRLDPGPPRITNPGTDAPVADGPMVPSVPTCADHLENGAETDIDCGGDNACARCPNGRSCLVGTDCSAGVCTTLVCRAPACANQTVDGQETDVDCGGTQCGPCVQGKHCQVVDDCASRTCTAGTCETPSCTDHALNGGETDTDCGGMECLACPPQAGCAISRDCITGICTSGICAVATCTDGVKNQNETAIDCGGSCPACVDGQTCGQGQDCQSGVCPNGTCAAAICTDAAKNGSESDVDCGGSCPTMCANGKRCGQNSDCAGGVCTTALCQSATCADKIKDGNETDTDCGGPNCGPCLEGKACTIASDCQSQVCPPGTGTCAAPSCSDMIRNGTESDVNCGGSCPGCVDGKKCTAGGDCVSLVCNTAMGTCAAPSCSDAVKNGFEADRDCGKPTSGCLKCAPGKTCGEGPDCDSGNCMGGLCQAASCTDGIQNGMETGPDCGGGGCPACADGKRCLRGSDCKSGVCPAATSTCAVPTCADLVKNGTETDTDCGGSCAPTKRCPDGGGCATGGDCLDAVCGPGKICLPPSCADLAKNGTETDADCGGSCAPAKRCADGMGCGTLGTNCLNSVCTTGVCQMSSCGDLTRNGTETDVDCGGASCGKCADSKMCLAAGDCLSGVCPATTHLCAAPSCTDTAKNGTETDLNCGGTLCPKCADGNACIAGTDCVSGVCSAGNVCVAPTCGDLVKNGTEAAVDCGGSCAPTKRCANNQTCLVAGDCISAVCPVATHLCAAATCSDVVLNGSETDIDCGGSCAPAQRCANNLMCIVPGDCVSASCVLSRCSAAGCQNCWKVQYKNRDPNTAQQTLASFNIVSIGTTSVPLSQLTIRYWFTVDNGLTLVAPQNCDFAASGAGSCSNVTMRMVSIPPRTNANTYWEIGFNPTPTVTLAPGGNTGEIQVRFHVGSFANQIHTNDYSWSSTQITLLDWNKVTLYNNGVLVWGVEP